MHTPSSNGGFPVPPAGAPARVVAAHHDACSAETRIRIPKALPARIVRRVVCSRCERGYLAGAVADLGIEHLPAEKPKPAGARPAPEAKSARATPEPAPIVTPAPVASRTPTQASPAPAEPVAQASVAAPAGRAAPRTQARTLPSVPTEPRTARTRTERLRQAIRTQLAEVSPWRIASVPVAAGAVIAALALIQGGDEPPVPISASAASPTSSKALAAQRVQGNRRAQRDRAARVVSEATFTLALPAGWKRVPARGGAAFAATARGGEADATLWVQREPDLSFAEFEARSAEQVAELTGRPPERERIAGPRPDDSTFVITAAAPPGAPEYVVTGRLAGPYRYYLATTLVEGASQQAVAGVELIRESLVPQAGAR